MTLDEIPNDITRKTPSCFEPTIDYVVVKIPKWQFEEFPGADTALGTQMQSVGEVMAIGRTFKEALQRESARSSLMPRGAPRRKRPRRFCAKSWPRRAPTASTGCSSPSNAA